jgi:PhnB protein
MGDSVVNVSDGHCQGKPSFSGISLSLSAASDAEVEQLFTGLSDGGKVTMPLAKTFFSSRFGMVTDRFGVSWMVLVQL